MTIRTFTRQFTQPIHHLPADEHVLLELAGQLTEHSDRAVAPALASAASRGLNVRSGLRAGGIFRGGSIIEDAP